jgi:cadmium resistance protein CadD (predicted permease)
MESVSAPLGLSIVLFASTNVDDLLVLIGFFADVRFRTSEIVAGQYVGVAVLFGVSAAGALLSLVIPRAYLGMLGIFPILIGIRKLIALRTDRSDHTTPLDTATSRHGNIVSVALVTIANGGDNIGVYMPSFAVHSGAQITLIAAVFIAMTALWCVLARWMVMHRGLGAPLRRYGHILAPIVLIGLGILIVHNAGSIGWLLRNTRH